jgi:hypothetical protein
MFFIFLFFGTEMCSELGLKTGCCFTAKKQPVEELCEDLGNETSAKLSLSGALCGIV